MKKIIISIALTATVLIQGCAFAPNGWNTNLYTGVGHPYYSIGISGPLPQDPHQYEPWNWFKTAKQ